MKAFFRAFRRNADGSWTCIEPATYEGRQGRIQVNPGSIFRHGERFMNVDVAGLLEEQSATARAETESPGCAPTPPKGTS
jgi:hypothetical protein